MKNIRGIRGVYKVGNTVYITVISNKVNYDKAKSYYGLNGLLNVVFLNK